MFLVAILIKRKEKLKCLRLEIKSLSDQTLQ